MQTDRRRLDQIQDPDFLAGLDSLSIDELRARRDLAEDVENELSYYRRFLHGRLDLLAFEQRRRRGEESRSLIEALPEILTGRDRTGGASSRHLTMDAPDIPVQGRRHLDHVLGNDLMARLGDMSEQELTEAALELSDLESEISMVRQGVQAILDQVHAEVINRYKHDLGDPALRPS